MGSSWSSFLTGASGLLSWATFGVLPVYGEPEGLDAAERYALLNSAGAATAHQLTHQPGEVMSRGADAVWSGVSGDDDAAALKAPLGVPLWAWALGVGALVVAVKLKK